MLELEHEGLPALRPERYQAFFGSKHSAPRAGTPEAGQQKGFVVEGQLDLYGIAGIDVNLNESNSIARL